MSQENVEVVLKVYENSTRDAGRRGCRATAPEGVLKGGGASGRAVRGRV
jgi:hypothetical protein